MISFVIALAVLIAGYFTYGLSVSRIAGQDPSHVTPVHTKADGVDFVPLPNWKIFLIQFLNIAGLGPIFGAIMGVMYGPAAFLWISLGTIFAGAVHDYLSGLMSLRMGGAPLPEIAGRELGDKIKNVMRVFALLLMILVGAVFVYNPADLLARLTPDHLDITFWVVIIFGYYMAATLLPIDKLIGKLYPLFGFALLFMALGICVMLFVHHDSVPEIWEQFYNHKPDPEANPIFPMMFVTIACGAISGFHATQSPMMTRCLKNEKHARPIFYGAMVCEGVVALIWAAAFHHLARHLRRTARHPGRHRRPHHLGRHRPALRTPNRFGLHAHLPEVNLQATARVHTYIRHLLHNHAPALRCPVAIFRLVQSGACRLHPMGRHRMAGPRPQGMVHLIRAGRVHDLRHRHIHLLRPGRLHRPDTGTVGSAHPLRRGSRHRPGRQPGADVHIPPLAPHSTKSAP